MKKVTIIVSMLFVLTTTAQNSPEIWMSYELKPKKGMVEKFEQAASKKMKKYNSTAENAMFTFNIMDGENQGMYARVIGYKDWDFMNSQEDRSDELKYWRDNVDPYIKIQLAGKFGEEKKVYHTTGLPKLLLSIC